MKNESVFRQRRRQRGAMLIEAAIAVLIFALLSVACMAVISSASAGSDANRQAVIALNAGRHVIENLRNFKGAQVPTGTYSDATQFGPVPELSQLNNGTVSVTISKPTSVLKQAIITINWYAGERSKRRSRVLTVLLAGNGVAP